MKDRWTIGQYPRSWNKTNQTHAQTHAVLTTIQQSSTQTTITKSSSSSRYINDTLTNKRLSAAGGSLLKQLVERTRHMCGHVIKTRSRLEAGIIMIMICVISIHNRNCLSLTFYPHFFCTHPWYLNFIRTPSWPPEARRETLQPKCHRPNLKISNFDGGRT